MASKKTAAPKKNTRPLPLKAPTQAQIRGILGKLREVTSGPVPPELAREACGLCRSLRASQKHPEALQVARAGRRTSRAFRAEEALAALGAEQRPVFFEILGQDPALEQALGPVARVLRGEPLETNPPSVLPPHLLALCNAISRLEGPGEPSVPGVPSTKELPDPKLRQAWKASLELARKSPTSLDELLSLLSHLHKADAGLARAGMAEVAESAPELLLTSLAHVQQDDLDAVVPRALRALLARNPTPAQASHLIATVGYEYFDPQAQATAALLEAFAVINDPDKAEEFLEVAARGRADPVEVARGWWVLKANVNFADQDERKERIKLLENLALAAAQRAGGQAIAARGLERVALAWSEVGERARCQRAIERARPLIPALAAGHPRAQIHLQLADLGLEDRSSPRFLEGLRAFLQEHPTVEKGWAWLLESLSSGALADSRAHDLALLEAAEKTGSPAWKDKVPGARLRLGLRRPLDPAEGGTVGQLASDLHLVGEQEPGGKALPLAERAEVAGAHLSEEHQFVLRMVMVDLCFTSLKNAPDRQQTLQWILERCAGSSVRLAQLFCYLLGLDGEEEALSLVLELKGRKLSAETVEYMARVFGAFMHPDAFAILDIFEHSLTRPVYRRLRQEFLQARNRDASVATPKELSFAHLGTMAQGAVGAAYQFLPSRKQAQQRLGLLEGGEEEDRDPLEELQQLLPSVAAMLGLPGRDIQKLRGRLNEVSEEHLDRLAIEFQKILMLGPVAGSSKLKKFIEKIIKDGFR